MTTTRISRKNSSSVQFKTKELIQSLYSTIIVHLDLLTSYYMVCSTTKEILLNSNKTRLAFYYTSAFYNIYKAVSQRAHFSFPCCMSFHLYTSSSSAHADVSNFSIRAALLPDYIKINYIVKTKQIRFKSSTCWWKRASNA